MSEKDNIEFKLKEKLDSGEITEEEYNELYQKFASLHLLKSTVKSKEKRSHWSFTGSSSANGGIADGPVISSGKLNVDSSLTCQRLSISGSIEIDGDLTVIGKTSANGNIIVDGIAKFGGPVAVTGDVTIFDNLYSTDTMSISGRLNVDKDINLGGKLRISGKISAKNLKSSSLVKISGEMNIKNDFIAQEIEALKGNSNVGKDVRAEIITISIDQQKEKVDWRKTISEMGDIEGIPDVTRFVTKMVKDVVPNLLDGLTNMFTEKIEMFEVGGIMEGKDINISNTHVKGDLIGDVIHIGPNVSVGGKIKYRKVIEFSEESDLEYEKID